MWALADRAKGPGCGCHPDAGGRMTLCSSIVGLRTTTGVVLGIDVSRQALSAARWAADEAVQRHQGINVVYAAHLPAVGYPAFGYPAD